MFDQGKHLLSKITVLAAGSGVSGTLVIEWNHIAERAIETAILAAINGSIAAFAGLAIAWIWKKLVKTNETK
jgi:hypothetical protein